MVKLDTTKIRKWNVAKKTKNIKAKPLVSLLVDRTVINKFLIDTLEAKEQLGDGSIICIGESNDIWQQMPSKLLQKYNVIDVDNDGWMICEPKPENSVNCVEITNILSTSIMDHKGDWNPAEKLFIVAQWGESFSISAGENFNTQKAEVGDFICQNREYPDDIWIVRKKIFNNTYTIIN